MAMGAVALGLALSVSVAPNAHVIFSLLVVSVLIAAWFGGLLMGLAATVLGVIGSVSLSRFAFEVGPSADANIVDLIVFAIIGAVLSAFVDRRRRQQLQLEELRVQHWRLAEVMHSIGIGHWYSDLPTQQMFWDAQCKAHYGLPPDADVTLDVFLGCVHPDDRDRLQSAAERAVFGHTSCDVDYRVIYRDGEVRWLRALGRGFYDKAGRPTRFDGITVDITRQKVAEEALSEANRLKDQFLGALSHELRTPLNAVLGWARLLSTGDLPAHRVPHAISVIERNAQAQARLVEDLLDLSSIVTGKLRLRVEPVDLGAVAMSALDAVRPAADARQVVLRTSVSADARWLPGDPDRLRQIVWNLVANAVKFTPAGGIGVADAHAQWQRRQAGGDRHGPRHRTGVSAACVRAIHAGRRERDARRARPGHRARHRARARRSARRERRGEERRPRHRRDVRRAAAGTAYRSPSAARSRRRPLTSRGSVVGRDFSRATWPN